MIKRDSALKKNLMGYFIYLAILVLIVYGHHHLNLPLERIPEGLLAIGNMIFNRMLPLDYEYVPRNISYPLIESLAMAIAGGFIGLSVSVPMAWLGAFNVTPNRLILYPLARLVVVVCRSIHEIVWAMLFVAFFGFGPFPGMIVLAMVYIGFAGKLFAENIEAIDMGPVEAMRAVGANSVKAMCIGVLPQVMPVWTGIIIYGWDAVLRASTMLGLVGAGGIGVILRASIESLRYQRVGTVLIIIICLVSLSELISIQIRKRVT